MRVQIGEKVEVKLDTTKPDVKEQYLAIITLELPVSLDFTESDILDGCSKLLKILPSHIKTLQEQIKDKTMGKTPRMVDREVK